MAALLPLLLLSVAGGRYNLFRCQFTGLVTDEGCCPDDAPQAAANDASPAGAALTAAACCTRETIAMRSAPSELPTPATHGLGAPVTALAHLLPLAAAPSAGHPSPRAADRFDVPRTPILLVKRSLLI